MLRAGAGSSIEARLESRCAALDAALEAAQEELSEQQREITELSACLDDARSLASQSVVADHCDDNGDGDGRSVGQSFESRNLPNRRSPYSSQALDHAGATFVGRSESEEGGSDNSGNNGHDDEDHVRYGDGSIDFSCLNGSLDGPAGATILGAPSHHHNDDLSTREDPLLHQPSLNGATLEPLQSCDLEPQRYSDNDDDNAPGLVVQPEDYGSEPTPRTSEVHYEASTSENPGKSSPLEHRKEDRLEDNAVTDGSAKAGAAVEAENLIHAEAKEEKEAKEEMDITSLSDDSLSPVGQNVHVVEWFNAAASNAMDGAASPVTSNGHATHPADRARSVGRAASRAPTGETLADSSGKNTAAGMHFPPDRSDHACNSKSNGVVDGTRVASPPINTHMSPPGPEVGNDAATGSSESEWAQYWDVNGQPYWYCEATGEWAYATQNDGEEAAVNHWEGTNEEAWNSGIQKEWAGGQEMKRAEVEKRGMGEVADASGRQEAPPIAALEEIATSKGIAPEAISEATELRNSHREMPTVPSTKSFNSADDGAAASEIAAAPSRDEIETAEQPTPLSPTHRVTETDSSEEGAASETIVPTELEASAESAVEATAAEASAAKARLASLEARNRELEAALATLVCNNNTNKSTDTHMANTTKDVAGVPRALLPPSHYSDATAAPVSSFAKALPLSQQKSATAAEPSPFAGAAVTAPAAYPLPPPASDHVSAPVALASSGSSLEPSSSSSSSVNYSHDPSAFPAAASPYSPQQSPSVQPEIDLAYNMAANNVGNTYRGTSYMPVIDTTVPQAPPPEQQQHLPISGNIDSTSRSTPADGSNNSVVGTSAALALRRRAAAAEERAAVAEAAAAAAKALLAAVEHEALRAQRLSAAREKELENRLKRAESKLAALGEDDDDNVEGEGDDSTMDGDSSRRDGRKQQQLQTTGLVPRKVLVQQVNDLRTQAVATENALNKLRVAFVKAESEVSRLREDRNRVQGECAAADERAANHATTCGQERARAEAAIQERDAALASAATASAALASEQRRVARRDAKIAEVEAARAAATRRLEAERVAREEVKRRKALLVCVRLHLACLLVIRATYSSIPYLF